MGTQYAVIRIQLHSIQSESGGREQGVDLEGVRKRSGGENDQNILYEILEKLIKVLKIKEKLITLQLARLKNQAGVVETELSVGLWL